MWNNNTNNTGEGNFLKEFHRQLYAPFHADTM